MSWKPLFAGLIIAGMAAGFIIAASNRWRDFELDKKVNPVDVATLAVTIFIALFLQDYLTSRASNVRAEKDLIISEVKHALEQLKVCDGLVATCQATSKIVGAKEIKESIRKLSNDVLAIETCIKMSDSCKEMNCTIRLEYVAYKQSVTGASFPAKPYSRVQISDQTRSYRALHEALQGIVFKINRSG